MLMMRATDHEVREDSIQTAPHVETILLLNAGRFGTQREVIAGDLPSQIVSLSGFLVSSAKRDSSVPLVHLPLGDRRLCGISPPRMLCITRTGYGFQNFSPGWNVAS